MRSPAVVIYTKTHPTSLKEIDSITVVKGHAFLLQDDLATLILQSQRPQREIPSKARATFESLRAALMKWGTVDLPQGANPFRVANVQIPSSWIHGYALNTENLAKHSFVGLIRFGPGISDVHIEECAAATYGCLFHGTKHWEFMQGGRVVATLNQVTGDTVYIPPGMAHRVTTTSNGTILTGETAIVPGSIIGFARNMAALHHGEYGGVAVNTEQEALHLCQVFGLNITQRQLQQKGERSDLRQRPRVHNGVACGRCTPGWDSDEGRKWGEKTQTDILYAAQKACRKAP